MKLIYAVLLIALAGGLVLQAYNRLWPVDYARWHVEPRMPGPGDGSWPLPNGHRVAQTFPDAPQDTLERFDKLMDREPRTIRVAGSPADGAMTYLSRTAFWGFRDFVSVSSEAVESGARLKVYARSQLGGYDWGVNQTRIQRLMGSLAENGGGS